jgi:hypothetical protein
MSNPQLYIDNLPVFDTTVHPGDSTAFNRKLVQESYPYSQLSTSAALVTGSGVVVGFIIIANTGGAFIAYDNSGASGTKIFDSTGMTLTVGQMISLPKALQFNAGLYIAISGTLTLNAIYAPQ